MKRLTISCACLTAAAYFAWPVDADARHADETNTNATVDVHCPDGAETWLPGTLRFDNRIPSANGLPLNTVVPALAEDECALS